MQTIGERIRDLRESKGLNSKELANVLDINTSTYSKLENDKKSIGVEELKKITEYFSISVDHILGTNESKEDIILYMKKDKSMSYDLLLNNCGKCSLQGLYFLLYKNINIDGLTLKVYKMLYKLI